MVQLLPLLGDSPAEALTAAGAFRRALRESESVPKKIARRGRSAAPAASPENHPLAADLDGILDRTEGLLGELAGGRILVTGGTGFVGTWLLESLAWANRRRRLRIEVTLLARHPDRLAAKAPRLATDPAFSLVRGDVRSLTTRTLPSAAPFDAVIHAAFGSGASGDDRPDPLETLDTIVGGTRRVLELCRRTGSRRMLFVSSGAVYGRQPPGLRRVDELFPGAPDPLDPRSAYGEAKRLAELLCRCYQERGIVDPRIARLFAFVGPHLPLDAHFAVGNFLRDRLAGGPIRVAGDGTARRSWLHAADLTVWLWTILLRGEPGRAYNVGSEESASILDLARRVATLDTTPPLPVVVAGRRIAGQRAERYVPATRRAEKELGLRRTIDLDEALRRTLAWHLREIESGRSRGG